MSGMSSQALVRVYVVHGSGLVTAMVGVGGCGSSVLGVAASAAEGEVIVGSGPDEGCGDGLGKTRVGFACRASHGKIGGGRASGFGFVSGTW